MCKHALGAHISSNSARAFSTTAASRPPRPLKLKLQLALVRNSAMPFRQLLRRRAVDDPPTHDDNGGLTWRSAVAANLCAFHPHAPAATPRSPGRRRPPQPARLGLATCSCRHSVTTRGRRQVLDPIARLSVARAPRGAPLRRAQLDRHLALLQQPLPLQVQHADPVPSVPSPAARSDATPHDLVVHRA
jgi:hypothetical protein